MNIFSSQDIKKRLPEQATQFDEVNKNLKLKMKDAKSAKIKKAIDYSKAHHKNSNNLIIYLIF